MIRSAGIATIALATAAVVGGVPAMADAGMRPIQLPKRAPSRELWQIDQLQLPIDTPAAVTDALAPDHSMEAVIKRLRAMGVPFKRVRLSVTPDRLSPAMREFVLTIPPGEPFVNREPNYISVNVLIGRRLPNDVVHFAPSPSLPIAQKA